MPVVCEIVMTELVADLVPSPKSQLVRLLGDILALQQRRLWTTEMRAVLRGAPETRYHWLWAYLHNFKATGVFSVQCACLSCQSELFLQRKRASAPTLWPERPLFPRGLPLAPRPWSSEAPLRHQGLRSLRSVASPPADGRTWKPSVDKRGGE